MPALKVLEIRQETEAIKRLTLACADGGALPGFSPGAHIDIDITDGDHRSYSLIVFDGADAALRTPSVYTLGVLLEQDSRGGSLFMHRLEKGAVMTASAPVNDFPLDEQAEPEQAEPVILLGGGIGITPLISMAARLKTLGREFVLHYCGRHKGALAFVEPLQSLAGPALQIHYDNDETAVDLDRILKEAGEHARIYTCGPHGMMEAVRQKSAAYGIAQTRLHFESFAPAAADADGASFEVEIASTGTVYTVPPGKTILDVLLENDVDALYDCRRGDCGICQVAVLSGIPEHKDFVLSAEERADGKLMQICVSGSRSPRLVLDL